jgi:hypothetical protein
MKSCSLCGYCYNTKHVIEDFVDLLKKWEEKKAHCNTEPHKNQNKDEEVDMQVITQGRGKTIMYFQHGKSSG